MSANDLNNKTSQEKIKEKETSENEEALVKIQDIKGENDLKNVDINSKTSNNNLKNQNSDSKNGNSDFKNENVENSVGKTKKDTKNNKKSENSKFSLKIPKIKINDGSWKSEEINPKNGKPPRKSRVSFNVQINEYFEDDADWVCELLDYRRNVPPNNRFRRRRRGSLLLCCCRGNRKERRKPPVPKITLSDFEQCK